MQISGLSVQAAPMAIGVQGHGGGGRMGGRRRSGQLASAGRHISGRASSSSSSSKGSQAAGGRRKASAGGRGRGRVARGRPGKASGAAAGRGGPPSNRYVMAPASAPAPRAKGSASVPMSAASAIAGSGASAGGGAGGAAGAGSAPSRSTMFHRDPNRKPTGVSRAKTWSPEVENAFRMQEMGFRDVYEYIGKYGEPEVWDNGLYSKLQSKETGFFTYWRRERECEGKYLNRVKIFRYD